MEYVEIKRRFPQDIGQDGQQVNHLFVRFSPGQNLNRHSYHENGEEVGVILHRGWDRCLKSKELLSVCNVYHGQRGRVGLALQRIAWPYIFGGRPMPKTWHRRRLLPDEQQLLESLRNR